MAPKRQLSSNDSNDSDYSDSKPPARKKRVPKVVQPEQKAEVITLAADPMMTEQTSKPAVEERILERIRKCLDKAYHSGTPEAEAKAAFRMGSRLMAQHNITQAQAFEKEKEGDQNQLGGESVVAITAVKNDKMVRNLTFTGSLAEAMEIFFDCKSYSEARRVSIDWTFYGITTNTAAAAMAFEMAFNLTLNWASMKKGGSTRHSYCLGVAEGLIKLAEVEKAKEKQEAREKEESEIMAAEKLEQARRARELDRLDFQHSEEEDIKEEDIKDEFDSSPDSSDNEYHDVLENVESKIFKLEEDETRFETGADFEEGPDETDFLGDFETELKKNRAREATPPIKTWESEMQLTLFRAKAEQIAKEYLEEKNLKLKKRRKSTPAKDRAAYQQGRKDSHKVDVRRKKLEAA